MLRMLMVVGGVGLAALLVGGCSSSQSGSSGASGQSNAVRPAGLGDDPFLDELADSCFSGTLGDCDYLFRMSATGSAYSEYGATCGGRDQSATAPGSCDPTAALPSDLETDPGYVPTPQQQQPIAPPATVYQEPLVYCHYYDPITGAGFTTPGRVTESECLYELAGTIVG